MATTPHRHSRTDSVAIPASAWLPPFGARVQELLGASVPQPAPLSFIPLDWVQTTFPHLELIAGSKLEGYIKQLKRTVRDLAKTREVMSDGEPNHPLVLHALEGMVEAYLGLFDSIKEMIKFQGVELKAFHAANPDAAVNAALAAAQKAMATDSNGNANGTATSPSSAAATAAAASASPASPVSAVEMQRQILDSDHSTLTSIKRHCVRTLRALRNLHVLVCAVDCLKDILADKEFRCARLTFQAITDIYNTLTLYSKLTLLSQLNDHVDIYKAHLRKEIFQAFREHVGKMLEGTLPGMPPAVRNKLIAQGKDVTTPRMISLSKLHHCCKLIDLLYSSVERKELVKWWVSVQIHAYQQQVTRKVFGDTTGQSSPTVYTASGALAGFEPLEKQFAWIWAELKDMYDAEYAQVFPRGWYVDALFVRRFFETLRLQIASTLEADEKRIKDENETRRAVSEAKKAQRIMQDIRAIRENGNSSGGSLNTGGSRKPKPAPSTDSESGANGTSPSPASGGLSPSDSQSGSLSAAASSSNTALDLDDTPLVFDFYKPLLRTIEFENTMRARWINAQSESMNLTEEDLFAVLGTIPNPALSDTGAAANPNPPPYPFQFAGYISSAFHPYLHHMLLAERTRFYNFLESLDEQEQWEVESAEISTCHFSAATTLFVMISKSMERNSKVMPGDAFLDLFKEYRTSISNYLELLSKHLPSAKNLDPEEVQSICATINTSDYMLDRCADLASTVISMLSGRSPEQLAMGPEEDPTMTEDVQSFIAVLREQVDLTSVEEQVSHLTHRATHVLGANIVANLEPFLAHMKDRSNGMKEAPGSSGASGGGVTDENKYVREIISSLRAQLGDKAKMSSFAYLSQVVAQDFLKSYHYTLKHCSFKITEGVAQQLLLDLQSLKNFLLTGVQEMKIQANKEISKGKRAAMEEAAKAAHADAAQAALGMSPRSADAAASAASVAPAFKSYVKMIAVQVLPSENLLKALTSPNARLISTFKAIFPRAPAEGVLELLNLRGLTSGEQEKLIKAYNATVPPDQAVPIVKKDFMGKMEQMMRDVKHSIN